MTTRVCPVCKAESEIEDWKAEDGGLVETLACGHRIINYGTEWCTFCSEMQDVVDISTEVRGERHGQRVLRVTHLACSHYIAVPSGEMIPW